MFAAFAAHVLLQVLFQKRGEWFGVLPTGSPYRFLMQRWNAARVWRRQREFCYAKRAITAEE
jgi:hypothetical protein